MVASKVFSEVNVLFESILYFDDVKLKELLELKNGSSDLIKEIVNDYIQTSRLEVNQILEAGRVSDYKTLYKLSHSLKSSSYAVGTLRIAKLSEEIEKSSRKNDQKALEIFLNFIEPFLQKTEAKLKLFIQNC